MMPGKSSQQQSEFSKENPGKSRHCPTSLYDYHMQVVTEYKVKNGLKHESQAVQQIIEFFDKTYGKTFLKNIILWILYPFATAGLLFFIAKNLYDMNDAMIAEGLRFEALFRFASTVNLFSISFILLALISTVMFVSIVKKRGY